jgi:hypothetical protein
MPPRFPILEKTAAKIFIPVDPGSQQPFPLNNRKGAIMAKQTTLTPAAPQAADAQAQLPTYDASEDDQDISYLQGVGVPIEHPAHDPSQPGKMPYEYAINVVPSAIK